MLIEFTKDFANNWKIGDVYYNGSYAGSGYQVNLLVENKLYWYNNNRFEEYGGDANTVNGHTINADVPSGAKFTDTTSFTITANATDGYWNLSGTNGTNAVTYSLSPYSSKQSGASFYTGATNPDGSARLNYNGYLYSTKLYSGGAEVLTSH